jgi:hypothetical protein
MVIDLPHIKISQDKKSKCAFDKLKTSDNISSTDF